MKLKIITAFSIILFLISFSNCTLSQSDKVKEMYDKHEYLIEMRDGIKLFTAVYTPKDKSKIYPILLMRTPYSVAPYGEDK